MYWLCCKRRLAKRAEDRFDGWHWYCAHASFRFLQSVAGLVMLSMYTHGIDLTTTTGIKNLYTVVVGAICAASGAGLTWPFIGPAYLFPWDLILASNNVAVFAIWAKAYAGQNDPGLVDSSDEEVLMHHGVYVDAASMTLWCLTAFYTGIKLNMRRKHGGYY